MDKTDAAAEGFGRRVFLYPTAIVVGVLLLILFVAVRAPDVSDSGRRTVIRIWHGRGGLHLERFERSVRLFEQAHSQIATELLYVPNDLSNCQKFYTAVIGNCAPEVAFVDGPQVAEWAERGLLLPLDEMLEELTRIK